MSEKSKFAEAEGQNERLDVEMDAELNEVLGNFRACIHGWSEAAYHRPRKAIAAAPRHRVWRLAAGWALGCVLVAGAVTAGIYMGGQEHQHRQEVARLDQQVSQMAAARASQVAEQQRLTITKPAQVVEELTAKENKEESLAKEELLAKVDSAVSQQVPSAMEPLAQLMTMDDSQ
jgi:hypothetical protein